MNQVSNPGRELENLNLNKEKQIMPRKNRKYEIKDLVLPTLDLPDPCRVKIEIRGKSIFLHVGQRDWQWDYEDESLVGCGTKMDT